MENETSWVDLIRLDPYANGTKSFKKEANRVLIANWKEIYEKICEKILSEGFPLNELFVAVLLEENTPIIIVKEKQAYIEFLLAHKGEDEIDVRRSVNRALKPRRPGWVLMCFRFEDSLVDHFAEVCLKKNPKPPTDPKPPTEDIDRYHEPKKPIRKIGFKLAA